MFFEHNDYLFFHILICHPAFQISYRKHCKKPVWFWWLSQSSQNFWFSLKVDLKSFQHQEYVFSNSHFLNVIEDPYRARQRTGGGGGATLLGALLGTSGGGRWVPLVVLAAAAAVVSPSWVPLGGTGGGGRWVPLVGLAAAAVVPPSWVSLAGTITLTRI